MKIKVTEINVSHVIMAAIRRTEGGLTTFGDIATDVFGSTAAGGVVGKIIFENRDKIPSWHRIVNRGNHPVADIEALSHLMSEGYILHNGCIV